MQNENKQGNILGRGLNNLKMSSERISSSNLNTGHSLSLYSFRDKLQFE